MKKLAIFVLAFVLLLITGATPAQAADNRAFQYSSNDKKTPSGMAGYMNLVQAQVAITESNDFQFFMLTKSKVRSTNLNSVNFFTVEIDTTLDKVTDYAVYSYDPSTFYDCTSGSCVASTCSLEHWVTGIADAYAWQIPKTCLNPNSKMNVKFGSTSDGSNTIDSLPDSGSFWSIKTSWLSSEPCASYLNGTKRTHDEVTYICNRTSGSWKWRDYGAIRAVSAKYLTERAYYACHLNSKYGATLADHGKTLNLVAVYKYIISESDFECVKRVLKMPYSVQTKIDGTRALDGTVQGRWANLHAFWTYHPDQGLNITIYY